MGSPDVPLMSLTLEEASNRFQIRSRSATGTAWTVHAHGRTLTGSYEESTAEVPSIDVGVDVDPEMFYSGLHAAGLQYGPSFRRVTRVRVGEDTVVATVDGSIAAGSRHLAHPAVVDAAMQSAAMLRTVGERRDDRWSGRGGRQSNRRRRVAGRCAHTVVGARGRPGVAGSFGSDEVLSLPEGGAVRGPD